MALEALTNKDKIKIKAALSRLNDMYGSGGRITRINWALNTVRIKGGKTAERPFSLSHGVRPGTFRVKFAGQQAVTKPQ